MTTILNRSDKGLSAHQKQQIFRDSFSKLRNLGSLSIGGVDRDIVTFMTGDWEAGAERFGGQGASAVNPSFVCNIKSSELSKHGEEDGIGGPHNHNTVKFTIRSFESLSDHYCNQIREDAIISCRMLNW